MEYLEFLFLEKWCYLFCLFLFFGKNNILEMLKYSTLLSCALVARVRRPSGLPAPIPPLDHARTHYALRSLHSILEAAPRPFLATPPLAGQRKLERPAPRVDGGQAPGRNGPCTGVDDSKLGLCEAHFRLHFKQGEPPRLPQRRRRLVHVDPVGDMRIAYFAKF